jgi:hypothetical protein
MSEAKTPVDGGDNDNADAATPIVVLPFEPTSLASRQHLNIAIVCGGAKRVGATYAACTLATDLARAPARLCVVAATRSATLAGFGVDRKRVFYNDVSGAKLDNVLDELDVLLVDGMPRRSVTVLVEKFERKRRHSDVEDDRGAAIVVTCRHVTRDLEPQVRDNLDLVFTRRNVAATEGFDGRYDEGGVRVWFGGDMTRRENWDRMAAAVMSRDHRFLVVDRRQADAPYRHYRAPSAVDVASRRLARSVFRHDYELTVATPTETSDGGGGCRERSEKTARCSWTAVPAAVVAQIAQLCWLPDAVAMYSACRRDYGRGTAYLAHAAVSPCERRVRHPGNVVVVERCVVPPHLRAVP